MHKVTFLGIPCVLAFHQYQKGGGTAIQLFDEETGDPMCTATVNVLGANIPSKQKCLDAGHPEHVLIKDCDENEGMLKALQDAGVVGEHVCYVNSGWSRYPLVPLLVTA